MTDGERSGSVPGMKRFLRHVTYANAMSTFAAFVALGGVSYAAVAIPRNAVGTTQLRANAVTTPKIRNSAVTGAKIRNKAVTNAKIQQGAVNSHSVLDGSLRAEDFAAGVLQSGVKGDKGDKGDTGAKGDAGAPGAKGDKGDDGVDGADGSARAFAQIDDSGTPEVKPGTGQAIASVTRSGAFDGLYCIETSVDAPKTIIANTRFDPTGAPNFASASAAASDIAGLVPAICPVGTNAVVSITEFVDTTVDSSLQGVWDDFSIAIY